MTSSTLCPLCEEGQLHEHVEKTLVEYAGQSATLDSVFSICDCCGAEQASAEQVRRNKRTMIAFKKSVDGLLTGAQLRSLRESLAINQAQAARIFGGGPVAFSKYENDDVMQSEAMDKLLRVAASVPDAFTTLVQQAGLKITEPEVPWQDMVVESVVVNLPKVNQIRLVYSSDFEEPQRAKRYGNG